MLRQNLNHALQAKTTKRLTSICPPNDRGGPDPALTLGQAAILRVHCGPQVKSCPANTQTTASTRSALVVRSGTDSLIVSLVRSAPPSHGAPQSALAFCNQSTGSDGQPKWLPDIPRSLQHVKHRPAPTTAELAFQVPREECREWPALRRRRTSDSVCSHIERPFPEPRLDEQISGAAKHRIR